VFSTWLTKRVGGMVGRRQKRAGSVGGGDSLSGVM
jgi:hypothetical protein